MVELFGLHFTLLCASKYFENVSEISDSKIVRK